MLSENTKGCLSSDHPSTHPHHIQNQKLPLPPPGEPSCLVQPPSHNHHVENPHCPHRGAGVGGRKPEVGFTDLVHDYHIPPLGGGGGGTTGGEETEGGSVSGGGECGGGGGGGTTTTHSCSTVPHSSGQSCSTVPHR